MFKFLDKLSQFAHDSEPILLNLIVAALAFMAPLKVALISVLSLTLIDNVVAVWLAIKRGQTVESSKLRRTVGKLALYLTAISAAYITEVSVLGQEQAIGVISKAVICLVSFTELKSILENLSGLSSLNGQQLNFWQVIVSALQQKGGNQFAAFNTNSQTQTNTTTNTQSQGPQGNTTTNTTTVTTNNSSNTQSDTQTNITTQTNTQSTRSATK